MEAVQLRLIWLLDTAVADRLVGGAGAPVHPLVIVNVTALLARPFTVTARDPVVAHGTVAVMLVLPQLVVAADVPLNVTVLVPCEEPKLVPLIVIELPTAPPAKERLRMLGPGVK